MTNGYSIHRFLLLFGLNLPPMAGTTHVSRGSSAVCLLRREPVKMTTDVNHDRCWWEGPVTALIEAPLEGLQGSQSIG